mmetsp:Transcript_7478/g.23239  ORF Transcript_7478/g.23239 Transcript_7478/m.23239 type:complete len:356 (-) Transcript_7478:248-1315(-)
MAGHHAHVDGAGRTVGHGIRRRSRKVHSHGVWLGHHRRCVGVRHHFSGTGPEGCVRPGSSTPAVETQQSGQHCTHARAVLPLPLIEVQQEAEDGDLVVHGLKKLVILLRRALHDLCHSTAKGLKCSDCLVTICRAESQRLDAFLPYPQELHGCCNTVCVDNSKWCSRGAPCTCSPPRLCCCLRRLDCSAHLRASGQRWRRSGGGWVEVRCRCHVRFECGRHFWRRGRQRVGSRCSRQGKARCGCRRCPERGRHGVGVGLVGRRNRPRGHRGLSLGGGPCFVFCRLLVGGHGLGQEILELIRQARSQGGAVLPGADPGAHLQQWPQHFQDLLLIHLFLPMQLHVVLQHSILGLQVR